MICCSTNTLKRNTTMTDTHPELKDEERTRCEIWTRVMGYHRPLTSFNPGKQSEYSERKNFEECQIQHSV